MERNINENSSWKGSQYYDSLGNADQLNYKAKLTLSNGTILSDPYTLENWVEDVSVIPEIAFGDIYTYLIETPSVYTKESLKAFKSLEAYNFFLCGHVQDVYCCCDDVEFCSIKTKV